MTFPGRRLLTFPILLLFLFSSVYVTESDAFSPKDIHLVEDHSQLLALCAKKGLRDLTVLNIDAHDDLWPPPSPGDLQSVRSLLNSGNFAELEASGLFYAPWEKTLFNINNYLVVGHRLGIFRNVHWAVPVLGSLDTGGVDSLKEKLARGKRFSPEEIGNLRPVPPRLTGTLSGVPVTIGSLGDLPLAGSPVVLSIDLDFFPDLYKNPVSSSFRSILSGFAEHLRKTFPADPALTVISYSNNGGYLPISFRFLGDWLRQLLSDPSMLESDPPKNWVLKEDARYLEMFLQYPEAETLYREILSSSPDDPDARYSLGLNLFYQGRYDEGLDELVRAHRLDRAYILGFIDAAAVMERGPAPERLPEVLRRAERLDPAEPVILDALGRFHYNRGEIGDATRYYKKLIDLGKPSPIAHAYLGDSYRMSGDLVRAEAEYRRAISLRRKRVDTELPPEYWRILGEVQESLMKPEKALKTYREFLLVFPDARKEDLLLVKERVNALTRATNRNPDP